MKNLIQKTALLLAILLIFISCQAKAQETNISELFAKAGLSALRERISSIDFSLPLAGGGSVVNLNGFKGKVLFLNFWATWCGPCRAEMPSMEALYVKYKERGLEILAVNCMEKETDVLAFMKSGKLSFQAALDTNGKLSASYGIQAIPTTFLVDREGKIVVRLVGSINWDTPEIHAAIEELLNEGIR